MSRVFASPLHLRRRNRLDLSDSPDHLGLEQAGEIGIPQLHGKITRSLACAGPREHRRPAAKQERSDLVQPALDRQMQCGFACLELESA